MQFIENIFLLQCLKKEIATAKELDLRLLGKVIIFRDRQTNKTFLLYIDNDDGDDDGDDDGGVKRWDDDDGVGGCADSWELLGFLPTLLEQLPEIWIHKCSAPQYHPHIGVVVVKK